MNGCVFSVVQTGRGQARAPNGQLHGNQTRDLLFDLKRFAYLILFIFSLPVSWGKWTFLGESSFIISQILRKIFSGI